MLKANNWNSLLLSSYVIWKCSIKHVFKIVHVWHDSLTLHHDWSCTMFWEFIQKFLTKFCVLCSKTADQITKVALVGLINYKSRKVLKETRAPPTTWNRHTPCPFQLSNRMLYNWKRYKHSVSKSVSNIIKESWVAKKYIPSTSEWIY